MYEATQPKQVRKLCRLKKNDGGRADAGFKGNAGDCVVRAVCIATGLPYADVYEDLTEQTKEFAAKRRCATAKAISGKRTKSPRDGVFKPIYHAYLLNLGWSWVPTMKFGKGCTVHLCQNELPGGTIIVQVSKHLTCLINGVIHDTHNPSRGGTRCVYGYYYNPNEKAIT